MKLAGWMWGMLMGLAWSQPTELIRIPAGQYQPLYTISNRRTRVAVQTFYMDRCPVTNAQFLEFVRKNPSWRRSRVKRVFAEKGYLQHWKGDLELDPRLAHSPVVHVSWFAARAYARAQGRRLPTQQEWEYVAQASSGSPQGLKDPAFRQQILDWYSRPSPARLPAVGQGFRNVYGVCDSYGLVWEWVDDFNALLLTGESRGDSSLERNLYCAGGAAGSVDPSDYAAYMRYAFRSSLQARYTLGNLGFRCATSYPKGEP